MKQNKMGFTLVEIIVSIAIGAVVMMIAGGIILSSSNFMMTTTEMDIDKRATDSIVEFVRGEIEYSTDVRFIPKSTSNLVPDYEKDTDWHYLYIQDGELYRDGVRIFDKNFTNKKSLSILMQGNGTSVSNHRLDIKYTLINSNNETTYSSRDTVMFLNLSVSDEILKNGLYSDKYIALSNDGYWLFYTKKAKDLTAKPEETQPVITGTVADQIQLINPMNNKGIYSSELTYRKGEYVYFNDNWWIWLGDYDSFNDEPGSVDESNTHRWKKINAYWDENSGYQIGDIVIHNKDNSTKNTYYECVSNYTLDKVEAYEPGVYYPYTTVWKEISDYNPIVENLVATYYKDTSKRSTCVAKKLGLGMDGISDLEKNKQILDKIPEYDLKSTYKVGDFVKIEVANSGVYEYYLKLFDNLGKPGQKILNESTGFQELGWQLLSTYYSENSAYVENDVFYGSRKDYENFYKVTASAGLINSSYFTTVNPDNAGNINFYIPFDKILNGFDQEIDRYNGYIVPYNNRWIVVNY